MSRDWLGWVEAEAASASQWTGIAVGRRRSKYTLDRNRPLDLIYVMPPSRIGDKVYDKKKTNPKGEATGIGSLSRRCGTSGSPSVALRF